MRRTGAQPLYRLYAWVRLRLLDRWWDLRNWVRPRGFELSVVSLLVVTLAAATIGGLTTEPALHSEAQAVPPPSEVMPAPQVAELPTPPLEQTLPEVPSEPELAFEEPYKAELQALLSAPPPGLPRSVVRPARTVTPPQPDLMKTPAREAWRLNAIPVTLGAAPKIAIVIDDLGPAYKAALATIALPGPLTLAFLPYADGLPDLTAKAHGAGHELLVHMPWEPLDLEHNNPGPNALLTSLEPQELQRRLDWALEQFPGFVGINNHMGSAFSIYDAGLELVMRDMKQRGLLFLDSRTIGASRAMDVALQNGVPAAGRDVFLDHEQNDPAFVWQQLALLESIARKKGSAIAIGHPHATTLEVLRAWLPQLEAKGFQLVPISTLVQLPVAEQTASETTESSASMVR